MKLSEVTGGAPKRATFKLSEVMKPPVEMVETSGFTGPVMASKGQPPMGQDTLGSIVKAVAGEHEDYPEMPGVMGLDSAGTPEGKLNVLKRFYPEARIASADKFGNPLVVLGPFINSEDKTKTEYGLPADQKFYFNKPGASFADVDAIQQIAEDAVPIVATGMGTGGLGWLRAAAPMFASGVASEAGSQAKSNIAGSGEGYDIPQMLKVGAFTMFGDQFGRALSGVVGRLLGARAPKNMVSNDGQLTEEATRALRESGIEPDQLTQAFSQELQEKIAGGLTPEQALRALAFQRVGAKPTSGQVTREFPQQQFEAEAAKSVNPMIGNPIRQQLAESNRALVTSADDLVAQTGGVADEVVAGTGAKQALRSKRSEMQSEASALYDTAKGMQGANSPLPKEAEQNFLTKAVSIVDDFRGYIPESVMSRLQKYGLFGQKTQDITIREAEELRQLFNKLGNADPKVSAAMGELKSALDESVDMLSSGTDDAALAFQKARGASRAKHAEFSQKDVVEAVVSKKSQFTDVVPDEQVVRKVVFGGSIDDLFKVRKSLTTGTPDQVARGTEAWNNIRATTFRRIMDAAMNPNIKNELGDVVFSGARFQTELGKLGGKKLALLFSPKELEQLHMIRITAESVTNRVPGAMNTSNTASALLNEAFKKLPFAGSVSDFFVDITKRAAVKRALSGNAVTESARRSAMGSRVLPKAGAAAGAEYRRE